MRKKIVILALWSILFCLCALGNICAASNDTSEAYLQSFVQEQSTTVNSEYRGHIQNIGDFPLNTSEWITGPTQLGTVGRALRLEGFWIQLPNKPDNLNIKYEVHVENVGWMSPVKNGEFAGTQGKSQRIEAIRIWLLDDTGNQSIDYTVKYKGHVENVGDVPKNDKNHEDSWYSDGELLGTVGLAQRLEAMEIQISQISADLSGYESVLSAVMEDDYTLDSWLTYQAVVNDNRVGSQNLQSQVNNAVQNILSAQKNLVLVPKIVNLEATNARTVTISGRALFNLVATDVTVANNQVVQFTPEKDGLSAIVQLKNPLIIDENIVITIRGKMYDLVYKVEFDTLQIVTGEYDDDTANQYLAITMDNKPITAGELIDAGYTLSFKAYKTKAAINPINSSLFLSDATGLLRMDLYDGFSMTMIGSTPLPASGVAVHVLVQATKGTKVVQSLLTPIQIRNLNIAADAITSAKLINNSLSAVQNSRTLVTGETAAYKEISVQAGSEIQKITKLFTVKSSNNTVITVDASGKLTAQAPGTAQVTISYGSVQKTELFTVTNTGREPQRINADNTNLTTTVNGSVSTNIFLADQYGDPYKDAVVLLVSSDSSVATVTGSTSLAGATLNNKIAGISGDPENPSFITFTGKKSGTVTLTFHDDANVKIGTTTVKLSVMDNDMLAKYNLSVNQNTDASAALVNKAQIIGLGTLSSDHFSTDQTMDMILDNYLMISITGVNSLGIPVSSPEINGQSDPPEYTVTVSQSRSGVIDVVTMPVLTMAQNGYVLVKAGSFTGDATITVTNKKKNLISESMTISVEKVGLTVTAATLKEIVTPAEPRTFNYKDALEYIEGGRDPVVSGLTLTKNTTYPVRLDITNSVGNLYIDKNADGVFTNSYDCIIGKFEMEAIGNIQSGIGPKNIAEGLLIQTGDTGSILYKVTDNLGGVVAIKEVVIEI